MYCTCVDAGIELKRLKARDILDLKQHESKGKDINSQCCHLNSEFSNIKEVFDNFKN